MRLTLAAERLEDRVLLSAFTVINTSDSGAGSLRQAILDANNNAGADEIVFQAGLSGAILLTTGQMVVTDDLTITGNGQSSTTIDAQQGSRVFEVTGAGTNLRLNSLTLQNGKTSGGGGAVYSSAIGANTITIANCTLKDNATTGDGYGGGAILSNNGEVTITNSTLSGNSTGGSVSRGGAINAAYGNIVVTYSTLSGNSTVGVHARGGAIFTVTGDVSIAHSTLNGNSTAGDYAFGGAICVSGSGKVSVSHSSLTGNSTTGYGAGGGAIHAALGAVTVTSSTLSGNFTTGNLSFGGAIDAETSSDVTLINSTLSGNHVDGSGAYGGGAVFFADGYGTIVNSTITNNSANVGGGIGIQNDGIGESLTIYNSIIAGNTAGADPDFTAPGNPATTLVVSHSLIGDKSGTSLTETVGATPDADGNFIGGGAQPVLDPHLGPLQDNGGAAFTHALLAGSLALDHGDNSLALDELFAALANDQRGAPFYRIFGGTVDMGAFEVQPLVIQGNTAYLTGGAAIDTFVVRIGPRKVEVNGAAWVLPASVTNIEIDGLLGKDKLTLYGTAGQEAIRLYAGSLLLDSSPNGLTGHAVSVESITCYSIGGNDQMRLYGSAAGDTLTAFPGTAALSGSGYLNRANGFKQVTALGGGGDDKATLNGSTGAETLTASPTNVNFSGASFSQQLSGFESVIANGKGGADQATFNGSAGNDLFTAYPDFASLSGTGFFRRANGFGLVAAYGRGGQDEARLHDGPGDDTFTGHGTFGQLVGLVTDSVSMFATVKIFGTSGGTNQLSLSAMNPIQYVLKKYGVWV